MRHATLREVQRQAAEDVPLWQIADFIEGCDDLDDEEQAICWLVAYIRTGCMTVADFAAYCGRPQTVLAG